MPLEFSTGNILEEKRAIALVIPANRNPTFSPDSLDGQVYKTAGEERLLEERIKYGNDGKLESGDVISTKGCGSRFSYIIHVVTPRNTIKPELKLKACYKEVLQEIYDLKIKTAAIPLLGSGAMKFSPQVSFDLAVSSIMEFLSEKKFVTSSEPTIYLNVGSNNLIALQECYENGYCMAHYVPQRIKEAKGSKTKCYLPERENVTKSEALWYIERDISGRHKNQTALAKAAMINHATISRYRNIAQNGKKKLEPLIAIRLACAMNLEAEDFDRFVSLCTCSNRYALDYNIKEIMDKIKCVWELDSNKRESAYSDIIGEISQLVTEPEEKESKKKTNIVSEHYKE